MFYICSNKSTLNKAHDWFTTRQKLILKLQTTHTVLVYQMKIYKQQFFLYFRWSNGKLGGHVYESNNDSCGRKQLEVRNVRTSKVTEAQSFFKQLRNVLIIMTRLIYNFTHRRADGGPLRKWNTKWFWKFPKFH